MENEEKYAKALHMAISLDILGGVFRCRRKKSTKGSVSQRACVIHMNVCENGSFHFIPCNYFGGGVGRPCANFHDCTPQEIHQKCEIFLYRHSYIILAACSYFENCDAKH